MRVAHLVDRPGDTGGVRTYLTELLPALSARDIDGAVVSGQPGLDSFAGVPCVYEAAMASDAATLGLQERRAFVAALAKLDADVVYAHLARNPGLVVAAAEVAPVVLYAHDYYAVCPGSMRYLHRSSRFCDEGPGLRCFWRAYTERTTNRRPDRLVRAYGRVRAWREAWPHLSRVLVASQFVADVLSADGVDPELLRVVPYFTLPMEGEQAEPEQDVLYLGRIVAAKGVDVLLRALAAVPGATAAIAGDGPVRPSLERLAGDLGIADRVRFLGWTTPEESRRLLATSRVMAVPSLWDEPFGIVGIEAFAAGVPVVATAVGGIPSWLTDGVGGLLVERGDASGFATALSRLLEDESYRTEQSGLGRRAAARFSLDRHLELLVKELSDIAEGR